MAFHSTNGRPQLIEARTPLLRFETAATDAMPGLGNSPPLKKRNMCEAIQAIPTRRRGGISNSSLLETRIAFAVRANYSVAGRKPRLTA